MTRFRGTTPFLKQAHQHRANIELTANDAHTEKITRDCAGHCEGHTKTV